MPVTGLITAGIGAASSIFGSSAQANAAQQAAATQQAMYGQGLGFAQSQYGQGLNFASGQYGQGRDFAVGQLGQGLGFAQGQLGAAGAMLNPFISAGTDALASFKAAIPGLTKPFTPGDLSQTPGYQFTLREGLKGVQNSYAAEGLGSSGAALKGAAAYTTGLAQSTYNQQFENYLSQNRQIANLLYQPVSAGLGAAGTLAGITGQLGAAGLNAFNSLGTTGLAGATNLGIAGLTGATNLGQAGLTGAVNTGQGVAGSLMGYGNALAGGAAGVGNALTGGLITGAIGPQLSGITSPWSGLFGGGGSSWGGNTFVDSSGNLANYPMSGLGAGGIGSA